MKDNNQSGLFDILLKIVSGYINSPDVTDIPELKNFKEDDLSSLYNLAEFHSVKPQLLKFTEKLDSAIKASDIKNKIRLDCHEIVVEQLGFTAEFLRLHKIFSKRKISVIPFKGFWVAAEYYGNLGDRESVDIDLFVREEDLDVIAEVMTAEGYEAQKDFQGYSVSEIRRKFHEYNFDKFHGEKRLYHVEFHWRMSTPVYGMDITFKDLAGEIKEGSLNGNEIVVFSSSAQFLLLVMHHGGKDLFRELKQVLDFAMILQRRNDLNWNWIMEKAGRYHLKKMVLVALRLAMELSVKEMPAEIQQLISSESIRKLADNRLRKMKSGYFKGVREGMDRWLFRMNGLTGIWIKIRITWFIFFLILIKSTIPASLRRYFPYSEFV